MKIAQKQDDISELSSTEAGKLIPDSDSNDKFSSVLLATLTNEKSKKG